MKTYIKEHVIGPFLHLGEKIANTLSVHDFIGVLGACVDVAPT